MAVQPPGTRTYIILYNVTMTSGRMKIRKLAMNTIQESKEKFLISGFTNHNKKKLFQ